MHNSTNLLLTTIIYANMCHNVIEVCITCGNHVSSCAIICTTERVPATSTKICIDTYKVGGMVVDADGDRDQDGDFLEMQVPMRTGKIMISDLIEDLIIDTNCDNCLKYNLVSNISGESA